ncbi:MAG: DUF58 domain-containing protein [Halieaceae bacterium]|jgi:uncharacterized protein (DUF58 family)|nr:DUF58 domain-containing protein [Halieaceae bacterium]
MASRAPSATTTASAATATARFAASAGRSLEGRARERWRRWLARRIPPSRSVTLDRRRIFIFPSRTGFFFLLSLLLMLIAAINYQNNMAYALTFLLANLFHVAVYYTYANLAGLTLTGVGADDAFSGARSAFRLRLSAGSRRGHHALSVGWPSHEEQRKRRGLFRGLFSSPPMLAVDELDIERSDQCELRLHLPVGERGWFNPGRLRVESLFPLGLLRCWTWVDLDMQALVYPKPIALAEPGGQAGEGDEGFQVSGIGDDEFAGIRDYRAGDSPRRVYWKGLARGLDMQSKEYAVAVSDTRWLDWDQYPGLATERRLSALCHRVVDYHRRDLEFGLRIPGLVLRPAKGDRQRERALRALALYGYDAPQPDAEVGAW